MLAAMEDLLDTWPGTIIVVSHDRYLLERVTDQQYAVIDGGLRHLPGGVDQYLSLRDAGAGKPMTASASNPAQASAITGSATSGLSGAELRAAEKELASLERRIERLQQQSTDARAKLADLDQSNYELLAAEMAAITSLDDEAAALEERWLELSDTLD